MEAGEAEVVVDFEEGEGAVGDSPLEEGEEGSEGVGEEGEEVLEEGEEDKLSTCVLHHLFCFVFDSIFVHYIYKCMTISLFIIYIYVYHMYCIPYKFTDMCSMYFEFRPQNY